MPIRVTTRDIEGGRNIALQTTVHGLDTVIQNLAILKREARDIIGKSLFEGANEVMGEIKNTPLVPVDTGLLSASGRVDLPEKDQAGVKVTMGFGNDDVQYAAAIHEGFHHDHRTGALVVYDQPYRVGQIKYLEEPVNRNGRNFAAKILRGILNFVRKLPKK